MKYDFFDKEKLVSLKNISLGFVTGDIKNLKLKDQTSTENDPPDATEKRIKQFHNVMLSANQIFTSQYDTAFQEFPQFVNDTIRSTNYLGFKEFDRKTSQMVCFNALFTFVSILFLTSVANSNHHQ